MQHKEAIGMLKTLPSDYLPITGGIVDGGIGFKNVTTGGRGISGTVGDNDVWRVVGAATESDKGYLELSTGDNGNEPIYVRQYRNSSIENKWSGVGLMRTATLLDESGNTSFPGTLKAQTLTSQNINTTTTGGGVYCNMGIITFHGNSSGNFHIVNSSNMNENNNGSYYVRTNGDVYIRNNAGDAGTGNLKVASITPDASVLTLNGSQKITGDATINNALSAKEINCSTKLYVKAGNPANLVLGTGSEDVYVYNSSSEKYLQLKNDGRLTYSGKSILTTDNVNKKITVSSSAPSSPSTGDIWIKA